MDRHRVGGRDRDGDGIGTSLISTRRQIGNVPSFDRPLIGTTFVAFGTMGMGPLYSFDDADTERLLAVVRAAGIRVTPVDGAAHAYWFRRGLGLVYGGRLDGARRALCLGFGHTFNPFLWAADAKLIRAIEAVLQANGSRKLGIEEVA